MLSSGLALSDIIRSSKQKDKNETDDEPKKKTREEWKKAKELEEARKVQFFLPISLSFKLTHN